MLVEPLRALRQKQMEIAGSKHGEVKGLTKNGRERLAWGGIFGIRTQEQTYARWKEIEAEAKLEHITPHASGRHTFATQLNEAGWSANDIAAAGGWKSVALVQKVYIHSARDSQKAAAALTAGSGKKLAKALGSFATVSN